MLFLDLLLFICIVLCIICCCFLFKKIQHLQGYKLEFSKMLEIANVSTITERELSQKTIAEIKLLLKEALELKNYVERYSPVDFKIMQSEEGINSGSSADFVQEKQDLSLSATKNDELISDLNAEADDREYDLPFKEEKIPDLVEFDNTAQSNSFSRSLDDGDNDSTEIIGFEEEDKDGSYGENFMSIVKKLDLHKTFRKVSKN